MRLPIAPVLLTPLLSTALLNGPPSNGSLSNGPLIDTGPLTADVGPTNRAGPVEQPSPAGTGLGRAGRGHVEPGSHPGSRGLDRARSGPIRLAWPLAGTPHLVRPFEPPSHEYGPGHRGADLAGAREQSVLSAGDGVVIYAGRLIDRELVSVEHPGGLRTTYEPVLPTVAAGQHVAAGQPIGTLQAGHPGCRAAPPGTCLHWGARRKDRYLDPAQLIGGRLRLLPWDGAPSG